MKGRILLKALEFLEEGVTSQADFFAAVLVSGYGASMSKIEYEYQRRQNDSRAKKFHKDDLKHRKRRLEVFISKMKRDGLIEKIDSDKFKISLKGKMKLGQLKKSLPSRHYAKIKQNNPIIISFDIPEKLRRKRDWLREVVKNLGFEMIHKSVWVGQMKIPKSFIIDLENLKILEHVEIFEISKSGSLKKLT